MYLGSAIPVGSGCCLCVKDEMNVTKLLSETVIRQPIDISLVSTLATVGYLYLYEHNTIAYL